MVSGDDSDGSHAGESELLPSAKSTIQDPREPQGLQSLMKSTDNVSNKARIRKKKKKVSAQATQPAGVAGINTSPPSTSAAVLRMDPTNAISVYSNMVIAEESLRKQYTELQKSRRGGILFFYSVVACAVYLTFKFIWNESIYQWIRLLDRLLMVAAYITLGLFFLTGLARKVFVVAPRFINETNKGLKGFNLRLVKSRETLRTSLIRLLFNPVYMNHPGGLVKLVLSPRTFSPQSIEAWELYREEFWLKEERRRQKKKNREKELSRAGPKLRKAVSA